METFEPNSPDNKASPEFSFVDAAAVATIKTGTRAENLLHAGFKLTEEPSGTSVTGIPQPDPHRVIAFQFIRLESESDKTVPSWAVALLHASGKWSVTELIGYPNRPQRSDGGAKEPLAEYLLEVTSFRILTLPPPEFEISLRTLHRLFLRPVHPNRTETKLPAECCAGCGTPHPGIHPHHNRAISRPIENSLTRFRVIDGRSQERADWVCYACQGVAEENGRGWPFEPWCTTIEANGKIGGTGGIISAFILNGLTRGHGRAWLQALGYIPVKQVSGGYLWRRPNADKIEAKKSGE